jgi:hypothetical protein
LTDSFSGMTCFSRTLLTGMLALAAWGIAVARTLVVREELWFLGRPWYLNTIAPSKARNLHDWDGYEISLHC